jgi:lipase
MSLGRVDVVSHSYGGVLALGLLAAVPERVRSVVLLDPALAQPGAMASDGATGVIEHPGFADADEAARWRNGGLGDEIHPSVVEEIDEHLALGDDGRYRFRVHRPALVPEWGELCHSLPASLTRVPVLLVAADRADFVTAEIEAGLAHLFAPNFRAVHLGAGHMLYWECFDETARAVEGFLADVDARTRQTPHRVRATCRTPFRARPRRGRRRTTRPCPQRDRRVATSSSFTAASRSSFAMPCCPP